jgi:hypothetical protein
MSDKGHPGGSGYEQRDTQVRTLFWLLAGLLAALLVVALLMKGLYDHFAALENRRQPAPSTLAGTPSNVPPEPRLQSTPFEDLRRMRAAEDAALSSYGWVDKKAGIVRIPIDRALDLAARGGLAGDAAPVAPQTPPGRKP